MDDSLIRLYDSCQENKGKYKCVIFLDIDGVLNDPDSAGYSYAGNYRGTIAAGHSVICEDMAAMLERIVQASGGEIILTSSWRIYYHDTQDGSLMLFIQEEGILRHPTDGAAVWIWKTCVKP